MIDWFAFVVVLIVSLAGAGSVVCLFAIGVRLLAMPSVAAKNNGERNPRPDAESGSVTHSGRPPLATAGAYACFALCGVAVLIAIYLIVPAFN